MTLPLELTPAINDIEARLNILDRYEGYKQVLTLAGPPLDAVVSQADGAELAKLANDEMADLVAKHSDCIVGAIATLPMHNMEAALQEAKRAVEEYDSEGGERCIRDTITSVNRMDISEMDKKKIFFDNARELLRLAV
jgi:predicted TIM-barrel fold metal-dependent hydrolase